MKPIKTISAFLVLLILSISVAWAAPLAGHVILSKGDVSAIGEDGTSRALKRRSEIFSGDTIKTGAIGSVQIRFIDKALMTIKANSEMNIEAYLMAKQKGVQDEKVLMSLVKGGFRTITGTIGKGDKSAYEVKTPAASIGIRGTNYEVQQEADGGFVMGVYSGGITVENDAGSLDLGSGADFNFTRVKPNTPPKGLLAPPVTLAENNATEQTEETDESSEESEGEQVASEETTDENEQNADEESGSDSSGSGDSNDEQGKTIIAQISDDSGSDFSTGTTDDSSTPEVSPQTVLDVLASLDIDVDDSITDALDSALEDTIEDTTDEFVETGGTDQRLLEALIAAGVLTTGQTLDDLDPEIQDIIEAWKLFPSDLDTLIASIEDHIGSTPTPIETFDFTNPYTNVDVDASGNPFATTVISDEAFALGETGQLALIALPINSANNYSGDSPAISTLEAQLTSPEPINFTGYDYTNDPTSMRLHYTLMDTNTGQRTEYELEVHFDFDTTSDTLSSFAGFITSVFVESDLNFYDEATGDSGTVFNPGHIAVSFNSTTQKFEFTPNTGEDEFIIEMELNFNDNGSDAVQALMSQMGSGTGNGDHWYAEAGLDLFIGNGSWDTANNKPILVSHDKHTHEGPNGESVTEDRIEVISKPIEAHSTVSSLAGFGSCIDADQTCDIQVDSVAAADNIRWGAWLAEPGEGIQITQFDVGENMIETEQEEQILAFWLAAERADINQLTGSASFTAQSDCARFSECIGFADDGIVQNLTANFDVNFDTGAITNGNLILETTKDPDLGLLGGTGTVESTWNVNFSGQMNTDSSNNRLPEFQSTVTNGTVVDSTGASSTSVLGNIGGIFVNPGDVFAGGYNLGTTDGTNKHAAGVFSMEKAP